MLINKVHTSDHKEQIIMSIYMCSTINNNLNLNVSALATKVTCKEKTFGYAHLIIRSEYKCFGPLGLH